MYVCVNNEKNTVTSYNDGTHVVNRDNAWASGKGGNDTDDIVGIDGINWWLRSPGGSNDTAGFVGRCGNICVLNGYPIPGDIIVARYGIRPAIWIEE